MSDPDSYSFIKLIDGIQSLSPSREFFVDKTPDELPKAVRVDFEGGRLGLLDMKNPRAVHWADVIDRLGRANRPVYVENICVFKQLSDHYHCCGIGFYPKTHIYLFY